MQINKLYYSGNPLTFCIMPCALPQSHRFLHKCVLSCRYELKDDVRQSLYEGCNEWVQAINAQKRTFMGGEKPNLADLVRSQWFYLFRFCFYYRQKKEISD